MFIIDAHLDLSMNALEWNRDPRQPVAAIRERTQGATAVALEWPVLTVALS